MLLSLNLLSQCVSSESIGDVWLCHGMSDFEDVDSKIWMFSGNLCAFVFINGDDYEFVNV